MAQQQEYFLYLGRNLATATYLHQLLVQSLRVAGGSQPMGDPHAQQSSPHEGADNGYAPHLNGNRPHSLQRGPVEGRPHTASPDVALQEAPQSALLPLHVVSNQKLALRFVQSYATRLVAVETTAKPASRRRFCESLRQRVPSVRILAIGPLAQQYAFAFDAVVSTPVRAAELQQVAELVRAGAPEPVLTRGPVTLNTLTREVTTPKGSFEMTPKQCALLTTLMRQSNRIVPRAEIMKTIWETSYLDDTRTLDVHIRWLRMMIEPDPAQPTLLVTKRGVGYQFVAADE
jgi:DNA-binding response OmpR family regulator